MQTDVTNVKKQLNVRTKQEIANEILDLEAVKKCYFHFLGTSLYSKYPENVALVEQNYHKVQFYLKELYAELKPHIEKTTAPKQVVELHPRLQEMSEWVLNSKRPITLTR